MGGRGGLEELLDLARRTVHRGKTHLFLGHPLSDGCDKTTVEPGNSYSPGVWTCGVSVWFWVGGRWHSPELLADGELFWTLIGTPGAPPVAEARYLLGPLSVRHRLAQLGGEGAEGIDFSILEVAPSGTGAGAVSARCAVVVRDVGPAGAKIAALEWDAVGARLKVNKTLYLVPESLPDEVRIAPAGGPWDSPAAALGFGVEVAEDGSWRMAFRTVHGFGERHFTKSLAVRASRADWSAAEAMGQAAAEWGEALPVRVFAPDPRVALTWERCAYHVLAAMENGLPRIGAVNYPVFWLRDCVIILRALDLLGRGDLARIGNEYLAPLLFSGGFGAESDAPGEGIWSLVAHARISGDLGWEREVFPLLRKRVVWIERMLVAKGPLRAMTENRIPFAQHSPGGSILCLAAEQGLIRGRMDWHSPDFYINCWAASGLRLAAESAARLGESGLASQWSGGALQLEERIVRHLLPRYGNPRDSCVAPYPSGALASWRGELTQQFERWYRRERLGPEGARRPEPLWTYFEAAQAHNALLLGLREEAWVNLHGMLALEGAWDVSAYLEGSPRGHEMLPFRNGEERRGWLDPERAVGANMPHNWTSAELLTLIRDLFAVEEGPGLVLGLGVPRAWMVPGARFGVRGLPTDLGPVSYEVRVDAGGRPQIEYQGPEQHRWALPEP